MAPTVKPEVTAWDKVWRFAVVGGGYAGFKFTSEVARGFADVMRIGDGVSQGGWGYAQDGLRLLVLVGPALKVSRILLARVAAVDATPLVGNCGWVAATRAARLLGLRHFAKLGDLTQAAGRTGMVYEPGLAAISDMAPVFRQLGTATKALPSPATMEGISNIARAHPGQVVMFGLEWPQGGSTARHAMLAWANPVTRTVQFLDRTGGRAITSLSELVRFYGSGVAKAVPSGGVLVIQNSAIVWAMGTLPTLANIIGLEVRSLTVTVPKPKAQAAAASAGSQRVFLPRQTASVGEICRRYNSDMPPQCGPAQTITYSLYTVSPNDTLALIAQRTLGNAARWREIYDANKRTLGTNPHDPHALKAGQELVVIWK